jgi:hypothetical protein
MIDGNEAERDDEGDEEEAHCRRQLQKPIVQVAEEGRQPELKGDQVEGGQQSLLGLRDNAIGSLDATLAAAATFRPRGQPDRGA